MEICIKSQGRPILILSYLSFHIHNLFQKQMDAFMTGFEDVVSHQNIKNFSEGELELLISGVGAINIKDWRDNTEYKNYEETDKVYFLEYLYLLILDRVTLKVIMWFWRAVLSFNDARRSRLLLFVTGTSRVPMNGFAVRKIF